MTVYADSTIEVPVKLTEQDIKTLLSLISDVPYGDIKIKTVGDKLKAARHG